MKIKVGLYQDTAVDDCSRFRVLGLCPRRSGQYTVAFLDRVMEDMLCPIQRIQTDRGTEFLAQCVQTWLRENFIKLRPVPPRSPHLNGQVDRSQLTDLQEFWAKRANPSLLDAQALEWGQFDYNGRRAHGALSGTTPVEYLAEQADVIPDREMVAAAYEPSTEPLRFSHFKVDSATTLAQEIRQTRSTARAKK